MSKTSAPMFCVNFNSHNVVGLSTRIPSTQWLFLRLPVPFNPRRKWSGPRRSTTFPKPQTFPIKIICLLKSKHARKKELFRFSPFLCYHKKTLLLLAFIHPSFFHPFTQTNKLLSTSLLYRSTGFSFVYASSHRSPFFCRLSPPHGAERKFLWKASSAS